MKDIIIISTLSDWLSFELFRNSVIYSVINLDRMIDIYSVTQGYAL